MGTHYPIQIQPGDGTFGKIRKIVGIQLSSPYPDICYKLVMPDYGICIIGSVLAELGFDVEIFIEHVEPPDWHAVSSADLVLMSTFSAAARRIYELADLIRAELKIPVVMGGTHATYFAEDCLKHCDVVVLREGDETIAELIRALSTGRPLSQVAGIAFRENGRTRRTKDRAVPKTFDTIQNYRLIRGMGRFSWMDVLRRSRVPLVTVQSSRGCPFHCRFCIVDTMFGGGYRVRGIESLVEDLRDKRRYGKELLFVDNYFGADISYTKRLLTRIIEEAFDFDIIVLCRIEIARDPELLVLMRRAGVTALYVGIESIQPETLKDYAKRQTVERIQSSIATFHQHGFRLSGSFVIGADTDTPATIEETVAFARANGIEVCYFFPLWGHYVERKLGNLPLIPRHRSIFKGWDYCDGNFVTHFPLHLRPSQLQQAVIDSHRKIYTPAEFWEALRKRDWTAVKEKAANRYAWEFIEKGLRHYIPWLQQIEEGFYDRNGRLLEDRLKKRVEKDPVWTFPAPEMPDDAGGSGSGTHGRLLSSGAAAQIVRCKSL
ncbi:MAG: B12-binding domain-containing radical SAM protein [Desulfobacterales bacterium]|nr:B12-binding domain-containing radical SAM protein [Desulfobacterales bacterium]